MEMDTNADADTDTETEMSAYKIIYCRKGRTAIGFTGAHWCWNFWSGRPMKQDKDIILYQDAETDFLIFKALGPLNFQKEYPAVKHKSNTYDWYYF
jgi:hypothetical protein